jgi:hemerythrin-like metal-binding protein
MPIVTWCDEYSVNVEEIDIQHKKILELVNNLHASVENRLDKQELERLLIELVDFTRMHFTTEEQLMKKYDYPELVKHQNEHNILLQHLDNLVAAVSRGKYPTFYSDYDVSSDWALIHISETDKRLGAFLNAKNIY